VEPFYDTQYKTHVLLKADFCVGPTLNHMHPIKASDCSKLHHVRQANVL
jgi:hypothetical protein